MNNAKSVHVYELNDNGGEVVNNGGRNGDYTVTYSYDNDVETIENGGGLENDIGHFNTNSNIDSWDFGSFVGTEDEGKIIVGDPFTNENGNAKFEVTENNGLKHTILIKGAATHLTYDPNLQDKIKNDIQRVADYQGDLANAYNGPTTQDDGVNVINLISTKGNLKDDLAAANFDDGTGEGVDSNNQHYTHHMIKELGSQYLLINIDASKLNSYTLNTESLQIDNTRLGVVWTNDFADQLIFNFVQRNSDGKFEPYTGTINISDGSTIGTVIAPSATVNQVALFSGTIIANTVSHSGSEIHKKPIDIKTYRSITVDVSNVLGTIRIDKSVTLNNNSAAGKTDVDGTYNFKIKGLDESNKDIEKTVSIAITNGGSGTKSVDVPLGKYSVTEDTKGLSANISVNPLEHIVTLTSSKSQAEVGFVNNKNQDTVDVTVTKAWKNADGTTTHPNGATVKMTLVEDGTETDKTITLDGTKDDNGETADWTASWKNLPKYKADGKTEIKYSVKETDGWPGYTASSKDAVASGSTITNTQDTVDVTVTKTWDDSNNQDGKRPESITIRLLADGVKKYSKTITAADGWKYTFTDLPKYADGKEITYTITEDAVPNYTTSISGYDVTNSYKPGKTSVTVTKAWDDSNNQDSKRPSSIEVQLYADGSAKGDKITLSESNKWTYTWTDLDEKKDGKDIAYTVQEVNVPDGYTSSISGDATKGYTITNSYKTQTVDISGTKVWSDQNNQYGVRPDNITIRLWKNGTEVRSTTISGAKDAATWSYSFTGLPKYDNGKEITYTVTEDAVAGYTTSISGHTITNSYAPNLVTIQGTKTWDDNNNADGLRPNSIVVNLLADGTAVQRQEVKAAADGTWTYSFMNLPSMANGKKITYTVTEDPVPGYTTTINGYNIINTHRTQKIDIPVTKVWANGASATSVEVELVANGTATGNKLTLSAATNWKGTFTGLDQYAANGSEITYTVQENTKGFNTTIAGSAATGFVITNSAIEANVTELHLHKYWADSDDVDHFRPTSVTVQIYADGAPYGNAVTLGVDNNWTYDLTGIPAEQDGHVINYTVEEVSVPDHYTQLVDAVGGNTFNITNIRKENGTWGVNDGTGDTFSVLGASRTRNVKGASRDRNTASTETTESVEGTRRARTGDSLPYGNLAATAAATAVLVGWGISRRKKKNQKDDDSKD